MGLTEFFYHLPSSRIVSFFFYLGCAGILFLPFSLSITQFFLYLASLGIIIMIIVFKPLREGKSFSLFFFYTILPFLTIYIWVLFSSIVARLSWKEIIVSEWKDVFLIFFGIWGYFYIQTQYRDWLLKWLVFIFILYILVGLISSFLPFRLSNILYHIQNGFFFNGKIRAQHLLFSFPFSFEWKLSGNSYPIGIYIPVGFTGTHLSFGSQIAMITLFFFFVVLQNIRNHFYSLLPVVVCFIGMGILFFSQARSSIFGFGFSVLFLVLLYIQNILKKFIIRKKVIIWIVSLLLFVFFIILTLILISDPFREVLFRTIGIYKKHTDYQRILLWYVAIRVFLQNMFLGVGAGNFQEAIFSEILQVVKEKPLLWYPLYQTEIMHGHNDWIHFLVIGGGIGAFLYLSFFYFQFLYIKKNFNFKMDSSNRIKDSQILVDANHFVSFLFLPVFLLFAGLFQCYFLDDYTMQLYWILYGISIGLIQNH